MEIVNYEDVVRRTATHEAGHALVCVIDDMPVLGWSIGNPMPEDGFVEYPNRLMRSLYYADLAGYAALGINAVAGIEDLEYFSDTDVESARRYVIERTTKIAPRSAFESVDSVIQETCMQLGEIFEQPLFRQSVDIIASHMLARREENGRHINERLKQLLTKGGIGRKERKEIRRDIFSIDVDAMIRSHIQTNEASLTSALTIS